MPGADGCPYSQIMSHFETVPHARPCLDVDISSIPECTVQYCDYNHMYLSHKLSHCWNLWKQGGLPHSWHKEGILVLRFPVFSFPPCFRMSGNKATQQHGKYNRIILEVDSDHWLEIRVSCVVQHAETRLHDCWVVNSESEVIRREVT